ncbi:MAG: Rrf2 family transcriptional regulator [Candidatus Omnitrophica bacterium]|nr:Rrf2 family transcriptional regulator [Candidatus Omnitrophota bacterium]
MRISARCDYACKALVALALHWPSEEPLSIQTISESRDIPLRYLVQILIQLKRAGIVISVRGKSGGYVLGKAPQKITLGEVVRNVQGPLLTVEQENNKQDVILNAMWSDIAHFLDHEMDKVNFESLTKRYKKRESAEMYYI